MKKFSTASVLSCCLMPGAGLCAAVPPDVVANAPLFEHRLPPRVRHLPLASSQDESRRHRSLWPQTIVLEPQAVPCAVVAGAATSVDIRAREHFFIAGRLLRLTPAVVLGARRFEVYRPGAKLASADGRAIGQLATRVGAVQASPAKPGTAATQQALVVHSQREIQAGDLVLGACTSLQAQQARQIDTGSAVPVRSGIAANVAFQRGEGRVHLAAAGQVLALDRGMQDGVRHGMCMRATACDAPDVPDPPGAVTAGWISHAGVAASVVRLTLTGRSLEAGEAVCIVPCAD